MDINVCYDPKKPTPSTDHRHGSETGTTFSLTDYSSSKPVALPWAPDNVAGKLGAHPVGPCGSFSGSATLSSETRRSKPLTAYGHYNGLPLSNATSEYQHGAQDLSLVSGGFLPDWLPAGLRTGATASRRPRRSTSRPHCNVRYTPEQVCCIDYLRDDCRLSWKEVAEKYASVFPGDAEQGHKRGTQGLQGVYYRNNKRM
ncbi:hypothetical protein CI238_13532, partial [Colletotrichum incanum]